MYKRLQELEKNAHAPYSNVKVTAILITKDGKEFNGVNVENAAYPSGTCAERSAVFSAVSNGMKPGQVKELHLSSSMDKRIFPCGGCRQVMLEFFEEDTPLYIYHKDDVKKYTIAELAPHGVTKGDFNWK